MAYETTTAGPSTLQRIGQGIKGALEGAKTGMDWQQQLQHAEQQRQAMQQEMQMRQQEMQQKQFQMYQVASKQQGDILGLAMASDSPENIMDSNRESYERMGQYGQIKLPFDDAKAQAVSAAPLVRPYFKNIDAAVALISDPGVPFAKKQEAYKNAAKDLETAKGLTRNSMFQDVYGIKKTVLDTTLSEASKNETAIRTAQAKATADKSSNQPSAAGYVTDAGQTYSNPQNLKTDLGAGGFEILGTNEKNQKVIGLPIKLGTSDTKPLSDMDELIAKSDRLSQLAQAPENAKMFGLAGGAAQADVPLVGRIKRSNFTADQLELYQNTKQLRTDYEKAQGGVREVANVQMQKAIAQNIPSGNLTKDQFISSVNTFNQMNKMIKAKKAAEVVRAKGGKNLYRQQATLEKLQLEPDEQQMVVDLLQGKKLSLGGQVESAAPQGKLDLGAAFKAVQ